MSSNTISLADCRQLLERGTPMYILDVRTPPEYARVHVTSAQLLPLDDLDAAAIAAGRRDAADPTYVICQSGARAAKACQRLHEAGLSNVYSIEGGTAAWEKAGLPVERGTSRVISLERQVRIAAGSMVFIGVILAWTVHLAFLVVPAFIGTGLVFAGITDYCGMALMLTKMPWNRRNPTTKSDTKERAKPV